MWWANNNRRRQARWIGPAAPLAAMLTLLVATAGCQDEAPAAALPPPVAALSHPEVARQGELVTFSAANSAVATVKGRPDLSAHLVKFRFQAADGSAAVDSAAPQWQHAFAQPGVYGVSVLVEDDRGQQSAVQSSLQVVADLAQMCSGTVDPGCTSGLCLQGACALAACAGATACPAAQFGPSAQCKGGYCQPGS